MVITPAVRSPQVHPDRRVTFRLKAPDAKDVKLELVGAKLDGTSMARDAEGIWTITTPALEPEIYNYRLNVVPEVERTYRVRSDRDHRAFAGFSMGGAQAYAAATGYADRFAWVCVMAGNTKGEVSAKDVEQLNKLTLFEIMVGRDDFLYEANKQYADKARDLGAKVEFIDFEGEHDYTAFRGNVHRLLPRLFKNQQDTTKEPV
jgi:S-formylglutathione hydrolase FrmB